MNYHIGNINVNKIIHKLTKEAIPKTTGFPVHFQLSSELTDESKRHFMPEVVATKFTGVIAFAALGEGRIVVHKDKLDGNLINALAIILHEWSHAVMYTMFRKNMLLLNMTNPQGVEDGADYCAYKCLEMAGLEKYVDSYVSTRINDEAGEDIPAWAHHDYFRPVSKVMLSAFEQCTQDEEAA